MNVVKAPQSLERPGAAANLTPRSAMHSLRQYDSRLSDTIPTANEESLLGNLHPCGNYAMDNVIGAQLIKDVLGHCREADSPYMLQSMLLELSEMGRDWRGIQVGAYEELARRATRK